ncbi:LysM peptidoglycan-binding domain-containing protein [Mumia sp. ZJ1417]|uniref:LysM peptidoglycan-binding domain-containing protein n=1 Tax=Mumia sp. ZJ1417 TaxID=2708082 RepID=UPI00142102E4|nr:LysM domain-containing protein [Mumia sp. ZJ1417]QMW64945.1 LysM peptidoglycan-binding domain-containing protein [Mumia sp. ZJ1417]
MFDRTRVRLRLRIHQLVSRLAAVGQAVRVRDQEDTMSTVPSTCDRTVITLDTPLTRAVARHPAGKGRPAAHTAPTRPTARPERRAAPRKPSYRLTRRGRFVVFLAAMVAFGGLTVGLGTQVIATSEAGEPVPSRVVTVQPGETVWDLAAEANPRGDIRETVQDIADLNSLASAGEIVAGATIYVPLY